MGDTFSMRGPNSPRRRPPPRGSSLVGIELQGYVITRALSSGGMGVVYEARHSLIGQRAAVKVLRPELVGDDELTGRFLREARAISAIKHPNIVEILNFGVLPGGGQYMLMEYLEGETLSELMWRTGPMKPSQALKICDEILSGLTAAHQVGVVHRDLKPANLILCMQSSGDVIVKVLDFGLARQFDTSAEKARLDPAAEARDENASVLAGTPEYISPEQASGRSVDGQADLYCLGVVLFEMLTGRLPFESSSSLELLQMHRTAIPPRVSSLVDGIAPELDAFVDQLLSKAPGNRPGSAKIARELVRKLRGTEIDASFSASVGRVLPIFREEQFADTAPHLDLIAPRARPRTWPRAAAGLVLVAGVALLLASTVNSSAAVLPAPQAAAVAAPTAQVLAGDLPPMPEPTPFFIVPAPAPASASVLEPAVQLPPAPRAMNSHRVHPRPHLAGRTTPPRSSCLGDEVWRRGARDQVDRLEQASLAGVSDAARGVEIAQIKSRARSLTLAVRSADGESCDQVEAQLRLWRGGRR